VNRPQQYPSYPSVPNAAYTQPSGVPVAPPAAQQHMYSNAQFASHSHLPQGQPQQATRQPRRERTQPSPPPNTNGASKPPKGNRQAGTNGPAQSQNSVRAAEVSLEHVGRALTNLRVSTETPRQANGRGSQNEIKSGEIRFPSADFDFAQSNARFNKAALSLSTAGEVPRIDDEQKTNPSDSEGEKAKETTQSKAKDESKDKFYDPSKSFFDTLSTSAPPANGGRGNGRRGGGAGGGGRGGRGRNRREEEREKNMSTFGEPGGVGLMGPGAYVGGWGSGGGYGGARRGRGGRGGDQQGARR